MLAIAIGLVIVAALYVAMDVQFRYMQTGRNAVVEGQLARGILNRVGRDVRLSLAALPSRPTSTTTTTPTTGATVEGTESEQATTATGMGIFNYGLLGDERQITLFVSTLPRFGSMEDDQQTGLCDLRKVTYWVEPGVGLARQEVRNVMAGDFNAEEGPLDLIAPEVVDLQFRYFDPSVGDYVTTWDGSTSGPPLAVEILLTVQAQTQNWTGPPRQPTTYRMVVTIPSASIPQELVNSATGGTQ
jgi:hypothetical protein